MATYNATVMPRASDIISLAFNNFLERLAPDGVQLPNFEQQVIGQI